MWYNFHSYQVNSELCIIENISRSLWKSISGIFPLTLKECKDNITMTVTDKKDDNSSFYINAKGTHIKSSI